MSRHLSPSAARQSARSDPAQSFLAIVSPSENPNSPPGTGYDRKNPAFTSGGNRTGSLFAYYPLMSSWLDLDKYDPYVDPEREPAAGAWYLEEVCP